MENRMLGRNEILATIEGALELLDYVYGMWQCGSAAFKRVDQWSDIDLVVDVEDDKVRDIFPVVDKALEILSPIEDSMEYPQPMSQGAYQKVYKLKGTSKFMVIEICALRNSSDEKFLQREIHGDIFVHFDKKNVTEIKPLDKVEFSKKLKTRLEGIEKFFNMYQFLVEKELNRNNNIEALEFYKNFVLSPLVEVLRIKYSPYRYNFRSRYLYYDLPQDVVKKLEALYFITDNRDLRLKYKDAIRWFNEIIAEEKLREPESELGDGSH